MRLLTKVPSSLKPPKSNQALKKHQTSNNPKSCLSFFKHLLTQNPQAIDSYSLLYVIKSSHTYTQTKLTHTHVIKFGYAHVIQLQSSLLLAYAPFNLRDARKVFDEMPDRNVVCCTALVSGYVSNGRCKEGLELVREMARDGLEFDRVLATVALKGCADIGALETGMWVYGRVREKDRSLDNAAINMYAKCGDVGKARMVFDGLKDRDVTTWTSMIVGHALNGQSREAIELFGVMRGLSVPNEVTFIGVLMACSHGGMVEDGKRFFRSMSEDYGLKPREAHFGCMVDLFCRAGLVEEAYEFVKGMPGEPNAVVWRTLLGACSLYGDVELGGKVRARLVELDPGHVGDTVALSNIYAGKGMWDGKISVRNQIKERRAPGCSSIEIGTGITEFVARDENHPQKIEIYEALEHMMKNMHGYGFSTDTWS